MKVRAETMIFNLCVRFFMQSCFESRLSCIFLPLFVNPFCLASAEVSFATWASCICQINSEFQALKTAYFLNWERFWCEKREKLEISEVVDNQRLPFFLHFIDPQKRCFWVVKAML